MQDGYLKDRLDELCRDVKLLNETLAPIAALCPRCQNQMEQHKRSLYGFNGSPGVVGGLHEVTEDMAEIKKTLNEQVQKNSGTFSYREKIIGLLGAATAVLAALAAWLTKLAGG